MVGRRRRSGQQGGGRQPNMGPQPQQPRRSNHHRSNHHRRQRQRTPPSPLSDMSIALARFVEEREFYGIVPPRDNWAVETLMLFDEIPVTRELEIKAVFYLKRDYNWVGRVFIGPEVREERIGAIRNAASNYRIVLAN